MHAHLSIFACACECRRSTLVIFLNWLQPWFLRLSVKLDPRCSCTVWQYSSTSSSCLYFSRNAIRDHTSGPSVSICNWALVLMLTREAGYRLSRLPHLQPLYSSASIEHQENSGIKVGFWDCFLIIASVESLSDLRFASGMNWCNTHTGAECSLASGGHSPVGLHGSLTWASEGNSG